MSAANVATLRTAHQAFNRRDFDRVLSAVAEDFTYRDQARNTTLRGREGFRQFMQGWVTGFSDSEVSDPIYIDAGDVVIAQFQGRGVHDGQFGPYASTGRRIDVPFCEVIRFGSRGQMVSGDVYYDQLSMLVQLGLAQPPAVAAV